MKKLIAMIATVAVVLSLGVTALAAPAVDKYTKSPDAEKKTAAVVGRDDVVVQVDEVEADEISASAKAKLSDKVEKGQLARVFGVNILATVKVDEGALDFKETSDTKIARESLGAFTLRFGFNNADKTKNVYVWENGDWVEMPAESWWIENGKVYVKTADAHKVNAAYDTYFAFVVEPDAKADAAKTAADAAAGKNPTSSKADGKASAATGYNSTAYIVCAIALAAGAAFFFGTSKKSAKEMM